MDKDELASPQTCIYKVVGGHEILADVYRGPGAGARPAILWIHGGALILGNRKGPHPYQLVRYLERGYVVVSIDYRLAPETKLPDIADDVEDAYRWVQSEGPDLFDVDPRRIAAVGHSGGGYLTLLAGARLQPEPRALVSFYGYGTITGPWYEEPSPHYNPMPPVSEEQTMEYVGGPVLSSAPPEPVRPDGRGRFYLYCRQQGIWPEKVTGHDPQRERDWFAQYEPLRRITPAYPPTMLLHGEADTDVDFEQALLMARELERQSIEHEFIRHPKWRHGFDQFGIDEDPVRQQAFDRVLGFLDTHLRD